MATIRQAARPRPVGPTRENDVSVELRGLQPVPGAERYGRPFRIFTTWLSPQFTPSALFIGVLAAAALLYWALQRRPATPIPEPPPENVAFGNRQAQSVGRLPPGAGRAAVRPHPHPATDRKEQAS